MTPNLRELTDALVAFLVTQTGRPVGRGTAPAVAGVPVEPPFAIVYRLGGGDTWGPIYDGPDEGARLPFQVTSVGLRGDQADWMADRVRRAMVGRIDGALTPLAAPGVAVLDREFTGYGSQDREGDVVSVPDTFLVHVVVMDVNGLLTEGGDTLVTEAGDTLTLEYA